MNIRGKHVSWDTFTNLLAIAAVAGMALWVHSLQNALNKSQNLVIDTGNRLRDAETKLGSDYTFLVEGCRRLQLQRVSINRNSDGVWLTAKAATESTPIGERSNPVYKSLVKVESLLAWTPKTNCKQAVNQKGSRYQAPNPIPFRKRLPTKDALSYTGPDG